MTAQELEEWMHKVQLYRDLCKQWIKDGSPGEAGRYACLASSYGNKVLRLKKRHVVPGLDRLP